MSGDDYISKLFLDNEHKLDEMPSNDLWSRIESKLETTMPGESTETSSTKTVELRATGKGRGASILRIAPYASAAAVLIVLLTLPFMFKNSASKEMITQTMAEVGLEEVNLEEGQPLLDSAEQSAKFREEEAAQEENIENIVKEMTKTQAPKANSKKVQIEFVESKDNSVINLSQEPIVEEEKPMLIYANDDKKENKVVESVEFNNYFNDGRNYATPPAADPVRRGEIEQIANSYKNAAIQESKIDQAKDDDYAAPLRSRNADMKTTTAKKADRLAGQLQIFDWMLGDWIDKDIEGGEAHEVWRRINETTIECSGYKLKRKGKEKIFEEKITIYLDPATKQVFMKMPVNDSREEILYMLKNFDTEYINFGQNEYSNYPDEVIFQRTIKGYKVIINHNGNFLESGQQAYFANRNRVTNVRAIRVLEPTK